MVDLPPTPQYVPSYGYVALFPLLMKLLPASSPQLMQQLEMLQERRHLWTDVGLRRVGGRGGGQGPEAGHTCDSWGCRPHI